MPLSWLTVWKALVGPQKGDPVTNAIPGLSWHQWGEAVDCFWVVNNKAVWDLETVVNGLNRFMVYANEAKKLGLDAGLFLPLLVFFFTNNTCESKHQI